MAQIKRLSDNALITVSQYPTRGGVVWECGDQRFTDATGTAYSPVGYPSQLVNAGHFYSLFTNQQQQDIEASIDPIIKQFLKNVNVLVASGGTIDLGSTTVAQGLGYLAITDVAGSSPTRQYITVGDIARISQNTLP